MKFTPLRITLIYVAVAFAWIAATDIFINFFVSDNSFLTKLQMAKGWFYVAVTGAGLYALIKVYERQVSDDKNRIQRIDDSLTLALESANISTWEYFVDSDSYITSKNHNRFFDYPAGEELTQDHIYRRLHPDDVARFSEKSEDILQNGGSFSIEYRIIDRSNKVRWLWTKGKAIKRDGTVERVTGVTSDITESKTLQKELDFEKEKFESLFEQIPVLITIYNPDLQVLEVNREFEKVLGWTAEDRAEHKLLELCYPDEQERRKVLEFMATPGMGWKEFNVTAKSGEQRIQVWNNLKLSDSSVVGIGHDITERVQLEREVKKDKERLLSIFNRLPVLIAIYNRDGEIVDLNDFASERLGYSKKDLLKGDFLKKLISDSSELRKAEAHMEKVDNEWQNFKLYTRNGGKLNTSWTNMKLSESLNLGVGLDLTEIKDLEKQLDLAVKGGGVGLWDFNPQSESIRINHEWAKMLGYKKREIEPVTFDKWKELTHPDDVKETERLLELHFAGELTSYDNEIRMRHKNGGWVWMLDRGKVSERDADGNVVRITGTHVDITERKQLEEEIKESRERLKLTTNSANVGLWQWNPQTGEIEVDEIWARLVGYRLEELEPLSIETWNNLVHPADLKLFSKTVETYFKGETDIYECEVRMRHKNGQWVWILDRGRTVEWDENGNAVRMLGTHVDITSRKEKEQELKESEQILKETQRVANLGTYTLDLKTMSVQTSEILNKMFWIDEGEELTIQKLQEATHPDYKFMSEKYYEAVISGRSFEGEYKIVNPKTGRERWIYEKADFKKDEAGDPMHMIGVMLDITRRKEQQLRITRALERLRTAEKIARIGYWEKNLVNGEIFWGENKYELFEVDKFEGPMGRKEFFQRVHKNDRETTLREYKRAEKHGNLDLTFRYQKSDGSYRTFREKADIVTDQNSGGRMLRGISMDVTALKEVQEKLDHEQSRFEYVTAVVSDAVWDAKPDEKTVWWSEGLKHHYKHEIPTPEEGLALWVKNIHPDDTDRVLADMKAAENSGATEWSCEYRFFRGDGSIADVVDRAYILREEDGHITRVIGAMNDITHQKEAEKELKRSEQQYRLLYKQSPLPMWIYDTETFRFLSVNDAAVEAYGYTPKEFKKLTIFDLFLDEDQEEIRAEAEQNLKKPRSGFDVWRQRTKSGEIRICEISGSNIDFHGEQHRLVVSVDITEQRKAEELAIKSVVEGEERERHRIANELHDGLGQYLSAANMHLSSVLSDTGKLSERDEKSFETGLQMLQHAISETRSISHNLLPKSIQDYGLKLAVESLLNELSSSQDIDFHLFQKYDDRDVPPNIQINVYRIIQEAINNAIKHSGADSVNTQVVHSGNKLICTIEDDGCGFTAERDEGHGLGIQSMRTRVSAMSGNLDIDSKKNIGTLVTAIIPLKSEKK